MVRLLTLRGGNLDGDRVPDGATKSSVLRAIASATVLLPLGTALKIVRVSSARYHAWRRKEEGCGLEDQPSCPKSFPCQLTREEVSTMRDFVESGAYRHIAVGASAINCYSGRQKLVHDRGGRQPARHGARDRADAY